jgi:hypothetical protein
MNATENLQTQDLNDEGINRKTGEEERRMNEWFPK